VTTKDFGILLVEDDKVDIMNVQRSFEKNNVLNKLHLANNGVEALNMLRGDNVEKIEPLPKVILLDINMPKMNGIEFLREIRQDPKLSFLTVFILTTSNNDRDRWEAYDLNVAGYILKPVSIREFMKAMSTLHMYLQLTELP
jgi:CheY-like chemotaxis protein